MIINRTKSNPYKCEQVRIMPGINNIPSKEWDTIKSHPAVTHMITTGVLVIVGGDAEKPKEFSDLPIETAKTILKETWDIKTLNEFKSKEIDKKGRGEILVAIDDQIKSLGDHHNKTDENM